MKKKFDKEISSLASERLVPELNIGAAFFYETINRYVFASQFVHNKIVLDAGCGVGFGSFILANFGKAKKVIGIDLSKEAISYAKTHYKLNSLNFYDDSVESLTNTSDNTIDVATGFEIIEHTEKQDEFIQQIKRSLKADGIFVLATPNKYNYPKGNHYHVKELYPEEFIKLLRKYFKNVKVFYQGFELTNLIKEIDSNKVLIEQEFIESKHNILSTPVKEKNAEHIVLVCSDKVLPEIELFSITSHEVDQFDLSQGVVSLTQQFMLTNSKVQELKGLNDQLNFKLTGMQDELRAIKSSKMYKARNIYANVKKIVRMNRPRTGRRDER